MLIPTRLQPSRVRVQLVICYGATSGHVTEFLGIATVRSDNLLDILQTIPGESELQMIRLVLEPRPITVDRSTSIDSIGAIHQH